MIEFYGNKHFPLYCNISFFTSFFPNFFTICIHNIYEIIMLFYDKTITYTATSTSTSLPVIPSIAVIFHANRRKRKDGANCGEKIFRCC